MAKRGVSRNPGYKSGSHWAHCDYCDSQFRQEDLKQTWEGWWACDEDWQKRHEQDFLRVKAEKVAAGQPLRPIDLSNTTGIETEFDSKQVGDEFTVPTPTHTGTL